MKFLAPRCFVWVALKMDYWGVLVLFSRALPRSQERLLIIGCRRLEGPPSEATMQNDANQERAVEILLGEKTMRSIINCILYLVVLFFPSLALATTTFPIATTSRMEDAVGVAFDGTNFLIGIGDKPEPDRHNTYQSITAQLVSKAGELVGSRILTSAIGGSPIVAFDGQNYLLAYEEITTNTVAGQFISKSGALVGAPFNIFMSPNRSLGMARGMLFDGANYFVVWESDSEPDNGDTADIFGQFITPGGAKLGSVVSISTAVHGQRNPGIAFDGKNILTVWADGRNQSACFTDGTGSHCFESDIYGQFITKSSASVAGTLSGSNFLVDPGSLPRDGSPLALAFDGTNYLVTFTEETTLPNACAAGGCNWEAYGILVSKAGATPGSSFVIGATTTRPKVLPVPTYVGTQYIVTWTDAMGTTSPYVKGQLVATTGEVSGSEFTLLSPPQSGVVPWLGMVFTGDGANLMVSNWGVPDQTEPDNMDLYSGKNVMGSLLNIATINAGGTTYNMSIGWNLLGNGLADASINVATYFGDPGKYISVWKWVPASSRWAFYSPSMDPTAFASYVSSKGFDVLTVINGGEGFWVNAK